MATKTILFCIMSIEICDISSVVRLEVLGEIVICFARIRHQPTDALNKIKFVISIKLLLFQITNLMYNSFILQQYVCYTTILNTFRAARCSSSGGQILSPQPLVSSPSVNSHTVCRWRADCSPLSTCILYASRTPDQGATAPRSPVSLSSVDPPPNKISGYVTEILHTKQALHHPDSNDWNVRILKYINLTSIKLQCCDVRTVW